MAEIKQVHFTGSVVSRNQGQSVVESAAYRAGEKLHLDREDLDFDYSRKRHVVYSEVLLADNAPDEWHDREKLWNAVEDFETSVKAQLARNIEFSLPNELPLEIGIEAAKELGEYFRSQGMCVDLNIHLPDSENPNPHCHFLLTMRPLNEDGTFVKHKCHREYILYENGQKIKNKSGKDYMSKKVSIVDWDDRGNMEKWRAKWASIAQKYLEQEGHQIKVEHRSYKRQGINRIPTIHMGPAVAAMERKGIRTEVGDMNREIRALNEMLEKYDLVEEILEKKAEKLKKHLNNVKAKEKEEAEKADTVVGMLMEFERNRTKFMQDNDIHQRNDTKISHFQDFAAMYAFLQRNNIATLDDLLDMVSKEKKARREAIHFQHKAYNDREKWDSVISNGELYAPLRKVHKQYKNLEGAKKEKYETAHYRELQEADSRLALIKKYTGSELYQPTKWKENLEKSKRKITSINTEIREHDENLEKLDEIITMVQKVQTTREVARRKEQEKNNPALASGKGDRDTGLDNSVPVKKHHETVL